MTRRLGHAVTEEPFGVGGGVYLIRLLDYVQIGHACHVNERLAEINHDYPAQPRPVGFIQCQHAAHAETVAVALHTLFDSLHVRGNWFRWDETIARYVAEHASPWPREVAHAETRRQT